MSEPWSEAPVTPQQAAPTRAASPGTLLEQMQQMLADLNANLAGLDADLQSSAGRTGERRETDDRSAESAARG